MQENSQRPEIKVVLIGGTSGAGKTTLGKILATRIDATSLSIDDLMIATRGVTTPESHPELHVMARANHTDYFTNNTIEQLIADTNTQHAATWPAVRKVIDHHSRWGSKIVIDGWALRPEWVAKMNLPNVLSFWLVADPAVLRAREELNTDFLAGSTDPKRMFENFMGRSLWYNEYTETEARKFQMPQLRQTGNISVEALSEEIMRKL